jgi:hypothetical protein
MNASNLNFILPFFSFSLAAARVAQSVPTMVKHTQASVRPLAMVSQSIMMGRASLLDNILLRRANTAAVKYGVTGTTIPCVME